MIEDESLWLIFTPTIMVSGASDCDCDCVHLAAKIGEYERMCSSGSAHLCSLCTSDLQNHIQRVPYSSAYLPILLPSSRGLYASYTRLTCNLTRISASRVHLSLPHVSSSNLSRRIQKENLGFLFLKSHQITQHHTREERKGNQVWVGMICLFISSHRLL